MSTKTNLILDLTIFTAFLAASNPSITGLPIHEWLSVALTAALVTHLLFHWTWIVNLLKTFLKKFWHSSRLNFVIDSLLFLAMILVMLSGILISKSGKKRCCLVWTSHKQPSSDYFCPKLIQSCANNLTC